MAVAAVAALAVAANIFVCSTSDDNMLCLLINCRSLCNKLNEFNALLDSKKPAVVALTESWLNNTVSDAMIDTSNNYLIYRIDRPSSTRGGGGFAFWFLNDFVVCRCL